MSQTALSTADILEQASATPSAVTTRKTLIRRLADILALPAERLGWNERAFTTDLLITTLIGMEADVVADVAERLSRVADLPLIMVRYLALQPAEIAKALLMSTAPVPETILTEAAHISPEHRMMIVDRDDLTSGVAEVLASYDEMALFQRLLRCRDINLTEQTLVRMVLQSQNDMELREGLIRRSELRPEHGFVMFWWLSSEHRKVILSRFSLDRTVIQDALQSLFAEAYGADYPDPVVLKALKLIDRRHRPRGRNGEVVGMDVVERTLAAALAGPSEDLSEVVGLIAGVSTETAKRTLHDTMGEPFAVLCKSIGLSRKAFSTLFENAEAMAEADSRVIGADRQEELLAVFDTLSRDYARTILRYWDWRKELQAVISVENTSGSTPVEGEAAYLGAV
jgi:uncharacterized protein (DUF2336 family)